LPETLETLLDFYENTGCGFHSLDQNGVFVRVNDKELNWLGYNREEVVDRMRLIDILPPPSRHVFEENFPRLKSGTPLQGVELEFTCKDGTLLPVLVSATGVYDENKNFVMSRSIVLDLSEKKRSEARFHAILEAAPDVILLCDADGKIVLVNAHIEKVLGYQPQDLQGRSVEVLIPERFRNKHPQHRMNFLCEPQLRPMGTGLDLKALRKDGTEVAVEISLSPVQIDDGIAVVAVLRDITDRRRLEDSRRRVEERYRLLFENSMDGIFLTSPDGRILDANPSACAITGFSREQLIAMGREAVVDTSDPAAAVFLEERKRTGKAAGHLTGRRSDGSLFPQEVSSVVFHDPDGAENTCTMIRDISRRKKAEAERERLIAELQEALAKVKVLTGLLSICSSCKKIRDDRGHWERLEVYIRDRSAAEFSHGLCPDCIKNLYPGYVPKRS